MYQFSELVRNNWLDSIETSIGASPTLQIRTGAPPANCAAASTGTVLVTMTLPADWASLASAGVKSLLGVWSDTSADNTGIAGHFRVIQGATCHWQGTVGSNLILTTNALTSANGNVLNFASTTGVTVGQIANGTGILPFTFVIAVTSTTVTLSQSSTAGVANSTAVTFSGDMTLDNVSIAATQLVTISASQFSAGGA